MSFVSIPYESHSDRRGYPEIRVVELFIKEKHQTKYSIMMKKGRRKEKVQVDESQSVSSVQNVLRKALLYLRKALLYSRKALLYSKAF